MAARDIDKFIITRGAIIALLDLTVVSFGSGRWNIGVLFAIGVSMICMAGLRRLPTGALLAIGLGWFAFGELAHGLGLGSSRLRLANGRDPDRHLRQRDLVIKYPVIPWLAIMVLGWALGRHANNFQAGKARCLGAESPVDRRCGRPRGVRHRSCIRQGYGDMFLNRMDNSWQQWLHVSKYPPSLSYATLELGLMSLCLAGLSTIEPRIGVRENGVFLVFGQTAMFFYLVHRLAFEIPATYFGLRGVGDLATTYWVAAVMLVLLYPACRWYRSVKAAHPESFLKYI